MEDTLTVNAGKFPQLGMRELLEMIDRSKLPRHVAIIMDGNGRWAARKGLPRIAGHKKGMEVVREVVTASSKLGIKALTLYAFSIENWRRPALEVDALMSLLSLYLKKELSMMMENDIRFMTSGREADLPKSARNLIDKCVRETSGNSGTVLNIALSYSGRWEIVEAARRFAKDVAAGKAKPESLDEGRFSGYLATAGLPDPDLVIRTSGEMRISNFLLWQIAYAELYYTDDLWPDFGERGLYAALVDYQGRQRRFGKTSEQLGGPDGV